MSGLASFGGKQAKAFGKTNNVAKPTADAMKAQAKKFIKSKQGGVKNSDTSKLPPNKTKAQLKAESLNFAKYSLKSELDLAMAPAKLTDGEKIRNAAKMYGTGSKQHLAAIRRFGGPSGGSLSTGRMSTRTVLASKKGALASHVKMSKSANGWAKWDAEHAHSNYAGVDVELSYTGFAKLTGKLAAKGAQNPGALAAYIGRKKYGKKNFSKLGADVVDGGKDTAGAKKARAAKLGGAS